MSFLHPILMVGFFYLFYLQVKLGRKIAGLKERSPEFADRDKLKQQHRNYAYLLLGIIVVGMIGGILATAYVLHAPATFFHTYGHGFFGVLSLGILVTGIVLWFNIKNVIKPKIKERFFLFHANITYLVWAFGVFSLVTGILTLLWGPSKPA